MKKYCKDYYTRKNRIKEYYANDVMPRDESPLSIKDGTNRIFLYSNL